MKRADEFRQESVELTAPSPEQMTSAEPMTRIQPEQLVGTTVDGKYVIESYLGGGGMSWVYLARHAHLKSRLVALKLLRSHAGIDANQIKRLQQEALAVSNLSHPNIIGVQDFGVSDNGFPYMAMDYFEGKSLERVLDDGGPLQVERLLNISTQICGALAHAHERGIVHRDIKPSNIMIGIDEHGNDSIKIVDFGIAKIADDESTRAKLTSTGDVLGSPLYMSPEQCMGQQVDRQSDIYSLGCVMYECATGRSAFRGDSVMETLHKQMSEAPAPFGKLPHNDPRAKGLEAVVFKMLAKVPSDRYAFMVEVASELKKLQHSVSSIFSSIRMSLALWNARRVAREQVAVTLDAALVATIFLSLIVAGLLIWLPMCVQELSYEVARTDTMRQLLDEPIQGLRNDDQMSSRFFLESDVERHRQTWNIRFLSSLCKGHLDELRTLNALDESLVEGTTLVGDFKRAKAQSMFGVSLEPAKKVGLGQILSAWLKPIGHGNELYTMAVAKNDQARQELKQYLDAFDLAKIAGVVLLVASGSLLIYKRFRRN